MLWKISEKFSNITTILRNFVKNFSKVDNISKKFVNIFTQTSRKFREIGAKYTKLWKTLMNFEIILTKFYLKISGKYWNFLEIYLKILTTI